MKNLAAMILIPAAVILAAYSAQVIAGAGAADHPDMQPEVPQEPEVITSDFITPSMIEESYIREPINDIQPETPEAEHTATAGPWVPSPGTDDPYAGDGYYPEVPRYGVIQMRIREPVVFEFIMQDGSKRHYVATQLYRWSVRIPKTKDFVNYVATWPQHDGCVMFPERQVKKVRWKRLPGHKTWETVWQLGQLTGP